MTVGRADLLDDHEAIKRLIFTYAKAFDSGALDRIGPLFTPDGVLQLKSSAAAGEWCGPGEISASMARGAKLDADGRPGTLHVVTNLLIEVGHDRSGAEASSYLMVLQAPAGCALQIIAAGRYQDSFRLTDAGWRFSSRVIHIDLEGDLSHHLRASDQGESRESGA